MSFWYDLVLSQNHAELKWHETDIYRLPDPSTGSIARLSSCNSIWQYCDIQSIFQNKQRDRSLLMNERVHLLLPTRSGWFFNSYAGLYGTSEIRTPVLSPVKRLQMDRAIPSRIRRAFRMVINPVLRPIWRSCKAGMPDSKNVTLSLKYRSFFDPALRIQKVRIRGS